MWGPSTGSTILPASSMHAMLILLLRTALNLSHSRDAFRHCCEALWGQWLSWLADFFLISAVASASLQTIRGWAGVPPAATSFLRTDPWP